MRRIPFFAPAVTITLAAGMAFGQATSGNIAGIVKDATGAAVPNATVVITNQATGVAQKLSSGSAGEYTAVNLLPGRYSVEVMATGFQSAKVNGLLVDLNKTSTQDVALAVGTAQTVEVSSDAGVTLDTTTTNLTTTFSNEELSVLPTATVGVGVLNASLLSPGVASSGGLGIGVGPSIGGQRPRNNNFVVEGIDNNNKAVTGPLVFVPNDAVGSFTLITNQFSPDFGHSSGGQFSTTIVSGTNHFHGRLYEYFQNRNLNAASGIAGGKIANPRYDNNRYGGQLGGPIFKDKLFFFSNFERNTIGQNLNYYLCVPTAAGRTQLQAIAAQYGFSATNLAQYLKYVPSANFQGGAQVTTDTDNACGTQKTGAQFTTVTNGLSGANLLSSQIALGNFQVNNPTFTNFDASTSGIDYNITSKDQLRVRYLYNTQGSQDTAAEIPTFFTTQPFKFHLATLTEFHTFTPNLTNEFRLGFNRYTNNLVDGGFSYPGLDSFPNISFDDLGSLNIGPDPNAPQFTIQNLYQLTDNIGYTKGKHSIKIGFDGRKYISPQGFTQRARGDYEYTNLGVFLRDVAPDSFGERSSGNHTYYGDQTALYGYVNDTYRVSPTFTVNAGLRYEFTSVPFGERSQSLNAIASVPGLINFGVPQPAGKSFAPRVGINYAPDEKTSIRAGFGIAYDVLFDNLGTLSFPPEYSVTQDVGTTPGYPTGKPNFLGSGGIKPGGTGVTTYATAAAARAATSAFVPNQVVPYTETYNLTIQHVFASNYTAEVGYIGTRGIHLPTQDQINIVTKANLNNQLFTAANGNTIIQPSGPAATNLGAIVSLSNIRPDFLANGFTAKITSYQPYSESNYNAFTANLTRRPVNGLSMNLSYTWSRAMDDATDEVFATVLTPRRQQDHQNIAGDMSRSALDRSHRVTLEVVYDLPYGKHSSNFIKKNLLGNWEIAPIYTYESPEYATVLSGVNSTLNGDTAAAIDRANINPNGVKGTGSGSVAVVNPALAGVCDPTATAGNTFIRGTVAANGKFNICDSDTVGYSAGSTASGNFIASNAYYVQAGRGTIPNGQRNTLPIRPIDNVDVSAYKKLTFFDHYNFEFGAQAFNVFNHAQYIPGSIDNVNGPSYTASYNFQTVTNGFFNRPEKEFLNNARAMQLSAKIIF